MFSKCEMFILLFYGHEVRTYLVLENALSNTFGVFNMFGTSVKRMNNINEV